VPIGASATEFATTPDSAHVAYQVAGDGPIDVAWVGPGSHLEVERYIPQVASYVDHLASFSRLIRFDLRGSGQSDPLAPGESLSLDGIAADLVAVLDAAGSTAVAVLANGYGGLVGVVFAATYLDRTSSLVLDGCSARTAWAPDYPCGLPGELLDVALDRVEERDIGVDLEYLAPSLVTNTEFVAGYRRVALASANRAMAMAQARLIVTADVRRYLPAVQVPTLVLYRNEDLVGGEPHARYLAEHLPNAKLVEIPGIDNLCFVGDTTAALGEIQEFLTGSRDLPELHRVLATVMFVDVVQSTERAAQIGDHRWREVLEQLDRLYDRELQRFSARKIRATGDGVLAIFSGPTRAIRCAEAIHQSTALLDVDLRVGLHTGELEDRGDDIAGITVHIAQRVCSAAPPGELIVSRTTAELATGAGIQFEDLGDHALKGVSGEWRLFKVKH
jgi:class 3 adenylate cyclase/pimeloyl-ACP methyl ester carboxylesterase